MRIMHVLNHTVRYNGHVHVAVDLACIQAKLGHDVAIASAGGDFDDLFSQYSVSHIIVDQRRKPLNLLKATKRFGDAFRAFDPEIVHAHMMTSVVLAWPWRRLGKFKLVTTVHNEFQRSAIIMGLGDRVIAVSDAVKQSMLRRGVGEAKLRVVLNGTLGTPRLPDVKPEAATLSRPAIVFVGGLHPRKAVDHLIRAFAVVRATVPDITLYILGDGPNRAEYEGLARDLGCGERVQFCGQKKDPRPYLLGSDIFVLASHADPAPLVIAEAREAGCAIIGTAVDGIPELLEHGKAGILVPPGDEAALASALASLLSDPALLVRTRQRSQCNIDRLSVTRVAEETIDIYRDVLAPP
jgi:glycosyltransferase involved in cell wall biosynthesis